MKNKGMIFTSAFLKVIGMVLMVVDHTAYQFRYEVGSWYEPMRLLGRISFPIFAYLIVDGMIYTRNKIKYIVQMIGLGVIISGAELLFTKSYSGNIMTTLGFSALTIYCLQQPKWWKLTAIFPYTLVFLADSLFGDFMPLRFQYSGFGVSIIVGFYACYLIAKKLASGYCTNNDELKAYLKTPSFSLMRNVISIGFFCVINVAWYAVARSLNYESMTLSLYRLCSLLAIVPILLYNGQRGYNKKWFKWACYLFYPFQFIVIYGIYFLIK